MARLLEEFGSPAAAFRAKEREWPERAGIPARLYRLAHSRETEQEARRVRNECRQLGISLIALGEPEYPEMLASIHDPPPILYLRGRLPAPARLAHCVAIVGTRKPSSDGLSFAYRIAAELAEAGLVIVSGLAVGIDSRVHRAVVGSDGVGIGVLAGGLDAVHPANNRQLASDLCRRGCLLSEQPPGTSLRRSHFVARNRLISGLSRAVMVVEAGERSGALITADFALEQGRSVLAMPGRPGDARVAGSLRLLRDGAAVAVTAGDVAFDLGLSLPAKSRRGLPELGFASELFAAGSVSFDAIVAASGLSPPVLLAKLGRLELDGRIARGSDGRYYLASS